MQPRCSCGALLPEDARFCHKCGKPQYEEDIVRLNAEESRPAPAPAIGSPSESVAPSHIGFGNKHAVKITLAVAALSFIILSLAARLAPGLALILLFGSGFAAASVYRTRTAQRITMKAGATLGAMTWFWLFLVFLVGTTFSLTSEQNREAMKAAMPKVPEVTQVLNDPQQLVLVVLMAVVFLFFLGTVSAAFGGMLAARLQPRGGQSS